MDQFTSAFARAAAQVRDVAPELAAAIVMWGLLVLVGHGVARAMSRMFGQGDARNGHVRLLARWIRLAFGLVGLVFGLQILGLTAVATSLLATGGIVAVMLGFASREIGENLLAGVFLGLSRSFEVGDLIESAGHAGVVRRIDLRQVHIRSADGRDIFIPSAEILRSALVNFTRDGLRRGDFVVGIDYADPVEEARVLLLDRTASVDDVLDDPAPAVRVSEFEPNYCQLRVLFWVDLEAGGGLAEVRSRVMTTCLDALRTGGFTLSSDVTTAVSIQSSSTQIG